MNKKITTQEWIEKVINKFPQNKEKYKYDKVNYVNAKEEVEIFCNHCNKYFKITPNSHLHGSGCSTCGHEKASKSKTWTTEKFINECKKKYFYDKYDYSKVNYVKWNIDVDILCKRCNKIFKITPNRFLNGHGCSKCNSSKGEMKIEDWLNKNGFKNIFEMQYKFDDCKYKK